MMVGVAYLTEGASLSSNLKSSFVHEVYILNDATDSAERSEKTVFGRKQLVTKHLSKGTLFLALLSTMLNDPHP